MVEAGGQPRYSVSSQGRGALMASMQAQGDHMLGHLVKMHAHTHFMAATVSSQVTQGSAPMCHPSVCWSVWIRSQRETMKPGRQLNTFYFFMCMFLKEVNF